MGNDDEGIKGLGKVIERYALDNALEHDGKADFKSVMNKVMADRKDLRPRAKELVPRIRAIVDEVNGLGGEEQVSRLEEIGAPVRIEKKGEREGLPPLENVDDRVVMRFAPGPSGPLHLGHTRAAILNDEYCKMYGGTFVNRIEDTDPDRILPEAYDWIPEDLEWMGVDIGVEVVQSDRFETYYEHATTLLEKGHAYVCTCPPEEWRALKLERRPCPHRERDLEDQLEDWDRMRDGSYAEGEAIVVVKTDLDHPNPAVRDWAALRICETPHPRTGERYRVYPLMNFSVSIDDHLLGLTHVLRGKDHLNNTHRQSYLYDYFGWDRPEYIHYGRVVIKGTVLSASEMRKGIDDGRYSDWDDPRLGSVRALARRGIQPGAIRRYWIEVGPKEVDIEMSWINLFSFNKDLIDPRANRYFFVPDPRPLEIEMSGPLVGRAPLHPNDPSRGVREVRVGPEDGVLLARGDLEPLETGDRVRLKDLCNVRITGPGRAEHIGNDLSILKEGVDIVQWVHGDDNLEAAVHMPDGEDLVGRAETGALEAAGEVVQFERIGFTRIEDRGQAIEGWFAHR